RSESARSRAGPWGSCGPCSEADPQPGEFAGSRHAPNRLTYGRYLCSYGVSSLGSILRSIIPAGGRPRTRAETPGRAQHAGTEFGESRPMILNILLWCLFGLIAGAVAQYIMPGKNLGECATAQGYLITTALGIVGAVVGGYLSSWLFGWDVAGFNLPSFV